MSSSKYNSQLDESHTVTDNRLSDVLNHSFYYLIRIYFILLPANLLIVKIFGFRAVTYWKDLAYILCFIFGFRYMVRNKLAMIYIALIMLTFVIQIIHTESYLEYFTWLIMGLPMLLYVKYIKLDDYDFDIKIIGFSILIGALWVFFFESKGGYDNTFALAEEGFTLMRDDSIRMRYYFVSPMAFSQYTWFVAILIYTNKRIPLKTKTLIIVACLYILYVCNTRAGVLLIIISLITLVYTYFIKPNKAISATLILALITIVMFQVIHSALNSEGNTSDSDIERLLLLSLGIQGATENFLLGVGGESFSPRSDNWLDFENSTLALINSFGIIGLLLAIWFIYIFIFKTRNSKILLFSIAWAVYSTIFPVLQETTPIIITWFIISIIILENKADRLFNEDNEENVKMYTRSN